MSKKEVERGDWLTNVDRSDVLNPAQGLIRPHPLVLADELYGAAQRAEAGEGR